MVDGLAMCSVQLPAGDPPEWIHLLPSGSVHAVDGRSWRLDSPAAVAATSVAGRDLVIDYEHQTDYAPKNGQPAPAAGWIKELQVRADGIWGRAQWTERAAAHIRAGEYRFLSPTFTHDKAGRIKAIQRAALTNDPALNLTALARASDGEPMNELLKRLFEALGLAADADETTALARVQELTKPATSRLVADLAAGLKADATDDGVRAALAKALKLDATTSTANIVAALAKPAAAEPDPAEYVAMAKFQDLATRLHALEAGRADEKAAAVVDGAIKDGYLTPAERDVQLTLARANPDAFAAALAKRPRIVTPGGTTTTTPPAPGADGLDADDVAICKAMGLKIDDYKKAKGT